MPKTNSERNVATHGRTTAGVIRADDGDGVDETLRGRIRRRLSSHAARVMRLISR
jgi:hypothetical protein